MRVSAGGQRAHFSARILRERFGHLDFWLQDEEDGQHHLVPEPRRLGLRLLRLPPVQHRPDDDGGVGLRPLHVQIRPVSSVRQHVQQHLPPGRHQRRPLRVGHVSGLGPEQSHH